MNKRYSVAVSNAALPAAAWYFLLHLLFDVSLCKRNNEQQKEKSTAAKSRG
jgi:hypothetical protein